MFGHAKYLCKQWKGHLVKITSAFKNTVLQGLIDADTWIGGTDVAVEGEWLWCADDSPFTYDNWSPSVPNPGGFNKDCAIIKHSNGLWLDKDCDKEYPYICEYIV